MNKSNMLTLASIFGIAAVILSFYGDTIGVSMTAAAGIALFSNYFLRRLIYKGEMKKDEITKRISSNSIGICISCGNVNNRDTDDSVAFLPNTF